MKKLTYIFLTLLLAGCTGTSRQPQLVAMDSLLLSRPDSALTLLRGMSFTDKADRMYHYLLLADACNKCYDTLPSDTILQEVADYYDRHGSANEQVRAHYLLGCAYRDMGEAPHALNCYHDAIGHADTTATDCDFHVLSRIYAQISNLYLSQNLSENALTPLTSAINYAFSCGDSLAAIKMEEYMMVIMEDLHQYDRALALGTSVYQQYLDIGEPELSSSSLYIPILIQVTAKHDYEKAGNLIYDFENHSGLFDDEGNIVSDRNIYNYVKGIYYLETLRPDSAESRFRLLMNTSDNANDLEAAYKGLYTLYKRYGKMDSIAKYAELCYMIQDTTFSTLTTDNMQRMQAMYDYTRHQEMARKAEQKAERARTGIVAILAVGVVILAIGAFFYQQYRNKKKAEIQQLNNDYGRALLEYNKLSAELERMKQQDGSLIFDKQQEVEELKARLQTYQAALQTNGTSQQLSVFQESSIMQTFRTKSRVSPQTPLPTETEWKRLVSQFSRSLPYAYAALGRDVILSTNELRVCILLLSGFKIADVAVLLDTSPQSITNLKARANNKLFGESSASTLERNLMNTVGLA